MSNFWEDLGAAARKVVDDVGTEVTVAAREQKLKEAYRKLGQMYYQAVQEKKRTKGKAFDAQVEKIDALLQEIQDLRGGQDVVSDEDFED